MKHLYTLIAALFAATGAMTAQAAADGDKPTVEWDQVAVVRNALSADITVTAKISIPEGTTFSYPVYPIIHSINYKIEYGKGTPQTVTLPQNGQYTSELLTWKFTAASAWGRDSNRYMNATMVYTKDNDTIELSTIEVVRDGTTGVDDIATDTDANAPVSYYTLQGVQVENPAPGAIYIRVQGSKATKVAL